MIGFIGGEVRVLGSIDLGFCSRIWEEAMATAGKVIKCKGP